MTPTSRVRVAFVVAATTALAGLPAAKAGEPAAVLFKNARVFDGKSDKLTGPTSVLVVGNTIAKVGGDIAAPEKASDINASGRTLMPGLIDAHTHIWQSTVPLSVLVTSDPNYSLLRAGKAAEDMLMRGFTAVREVGGNTFGLKRAIDEGHLIGPRIWPSGATLSQTSGHGDFRSPWHDVPRGEGAIHWSERTGATVIADGVPEVLRRTREQLMRGASHIKVMAGGGVSSDFDPLDVTQYTEAEIRAAVEAAEAWGTYVTVHAYTPRAVQTAIRAGVKCVEHGQMLDESTVKSMAEKGTWWCLQPFLNDSDMTTFPEGSINHKKKLQMVEGTDVAYRLARKHKVKTAFGTDTLFDAKLATRQGAQLAKLARWYTPAEVLKMATGDNGELLAMSGLRSPYQGKIGVVEEGALADLILVDGDPLADLKLIADPVKTFVVIMKDGKVYKNVLFAPPGRKVSE